MISAIFKYLLLLLVILSALSIFAQCIDESYILQGNNCPRNIDSYNPVCGCDGKTYFNACVAMKDAGVMQSTNGICEAIDFIFAPNPVDYFLRLKIALKQDANVRIRIIDISGNVLLYQLIGYLSSTQFYDLMLTEIQHYKTGIYYIIVEADGNFKMKKFAKFPSY